MRTALPISSLSDRRWQEPQPVERLKVLCRTVMTSIKSHWDIMAAIRRHWTCHALRRFRERDNLDNYDPESLIDLVDRIELKYRAAFASSYWDPHPRVMVHCKVDTPQSRSIPEGKDRLPSTASDGGDRTPAEAGPEPPQQAQNPDGVRPDTLAKTGVQHLDHGR
jgi:hypothetical protein